MLHMAAHISRSTQHRERHLLLLSSTLQFKMAILSSRVFYLLANVIPLALSSPLPPPPCTYTLSNESLIYADGFLVVSSYICQDYGSM
jgi:hypothetical protein